MIQFGFELPPRTFSLLQTVCFQIQPFWHHSRFCDQQFQKHNNLAWSPAIKIIIKVSGEKYSAFYHTYYKSSAYHVVLIGSPLFENGERKSCMQHSWSCKNHHGTWIVNVRLVEGFDVFEVEHVALHKRLADLLIGPGNKHFVVVVGLLGEAQRKVDWRFQIHSLPVRFQQNAKFLSSTQGKHWDQHFSSSFNALVHFLQKVTLPIRWHYFGLLRMWRFYYLHLFESRIVVA